MPTPPSNGLPPTSNHGSTRSREGSTRRGSHDSHSNRSRGAQSAPAARPQGVQRTSSGHRRVGGHGPTPPPLTRGIAFYFASRPATPRPATPGVHTPPRMTPALVAPRPIAQLRPVMQQPVEVHEAARQLLRGALQAQNERQITDEDLDMYVEAGTALVGFLVDDVMDDAVMMELFGVEPPLPRGAGVRQDRESVMDEGRRKATQKAIKAVRARFQDKVYNAVDLLTHLTKQLDGMHNGTLPVAPALRKMRLGVSELFNARRAVLGTLEEADRSRPIMDNQPFALADADDAIGAWDLVTLVWTAIHHYEAKPGLDADGKPIDVPVKTKADIADMEDRLYAAFAENIEVDCSEERFPDESDDAYRLRMQAQSFRACPVGVAERLICVLEGYYDEVRNVTMRPTKPGKEEMPRCTVAELLTEFCRELRVRYGDEPAPAKVEKTFRRALRRAHLLWGADSDLTASFHRQLKEWLQRDHDFAPAADVDPLLVRAEDDAYSDVET